MTRPDVEAIKARLTAATPKCDICGEPIEPHLLTVSNAWCWRHVGTELFACEEGDDEDATLQGNDGVSKWERAVFDVLAAVPALLADNAALAGADEKLRNDALELLHEVEGRLQDGDAMGALDALQPVVCLLARCEPHPPTRDQRLAALDRSAGAPETEDDK